MLPRLTVTFADCGTVVCHASHPDGTPGACCAFPQALFNVRHVRMQACSTGILRQLLAAASCGQLPALRKVSFVHHAHLTDACLLQLCTALPDLQEVVVVGCGGVTLPAMQRLSRAAGRVEGLAVTCLPA